MVEEKANEPARNKQQTKRLLFDHGMTRQYVPPKRRLISTRVHGVTTQKMLLLSLTDSAKTGML
jgi:hypothetical protein